MKKPQTIGQILEYFNGLTFRGVDLSLALCSHFTSDYQVGRLVKKKSNVDLLFYLARLKAVFLARSRGRHTSSSQAFPPADYLLFMDGVARTAQLTFPVVECLAEDSRLIVYTGRASIKPPENVPSLRLSAVPYRFDEWQSGILAIWQELKKRLSEFKKDFELNQAESYSVFSALCQAVAEVLQAEAILEKARPKLVFTEYDRHTNHGIILETAKKMGIPTATLVHGLRGSGSFFSSLESPLIADHIIVWGEWMRQDYIRLGVPDDQIILGGYPRLNPLTPTDRQTGLELLKKQCGAVNKPVAVMLSSSLSAVKPAIELFLEVQSQMPDFFCMIRTHPQERLEWYEQRLPDYTGRIQNPGQWTLAQTLATADMVIGTSSTACIDAILLGKPLILLVDAVLDYQKVPILQEAVERGVAPVARNADELVKLMRLYPVEKKEQVRAFAMECAACLGAEAASLTAKRLRDLANLAAGEAGRG